MLPRLVRRALAAAIVTVSLVAPASSQPLPTMDAPSPGLSPLWDDAGARGHQIAAQAREPLAPFVTSSVPEDALWEPFTQPGPSKGVFRIAQWHGKLVLAVSVAAAGHTPGGVVLWDGTSFEALPYPGDVQDLTIWNDQIVVALLGPYPNYGNQAIVRYNGTTWDTLGVTTNYPLCMHAFGSKLVVGGQLTAINGVPVNHIAAYDGTSWSALGTGFPTGRPIWLAVHNGTLVAAGNVLPFTGVAAWNEGLGVWQSIGTGLGGLVRSVESDGVTLYVSGRSLLVGPTDVGGLARWDGISWSAVPGAAGKDVQAMTPWNGRMVASVSRPPAGLLSQWDGVSLTGIPGDSLGYGMQFGSVLYHLTAWGTRLVATGGFVTNGSACIPSVAIYDGTAWSTAMVPWDATMRSPGVGVSALEAWNGKLVVAGTSVLIADQDHYMYVPDGNPIFDGTHWARLSPTTASGQYKVLVKMEGRPHPRRLHARRRRHLDQDGRTLGWSLVERVW